MRKQPLTIQLPPDVLAGVAEQASAEGRSLSQTAVRLIEVGLKASKKRRAA